MAVLGEAVDEGSDAGGSREDRAPVLAGAGGRILRADPPCGRRADEMQYAQDRVLSAKLRELRLTYPLRSQVVNPNRKEDGSWEEVQERLFPGR
jgi:hypothetical protein